jgi:hypothetical protein
MPNTSPLPVGVPGVRKIAVAAGGPPPPTMSSTADAANKVATLQQIVAALTNSTEQPVGKDCLAVGHHVGKCLGANDYARHPCLP